jgi:endonuclease/exonuclease/phosphatase family metal-dependent hydrolase
MGQLTLATANTRSGDLLRAPGGLRPLAEAGAGVVALQEVHHLTPAEVSAALADVGWRPAAVHLPAGLVLAYDPERAQPVGGALTATLQPAGALLRWSDHWHERGALARHFDIGGQRLTVATAHLIVFARAVSRGQQVRRLHRALDDPRIATGPLVLAGDMNHYPRPARPDRALAKGLDLRHVDLDGPTWRIRGSKHEWMARAGARVLRRDLEQFDAQLDAVLYRGLVPHPAHVLEVESDHGAVVCTFDVPG